VQVDRMTAPSDARRSGSVVAPVLMYHVIGSEPVSRSFKRFVVPPALFDEHLDAIRSAGYVTGVIPGLRLSERCHRTSAGVPDRMVYLTFDDGFASFMDAALTRLAARSMRGTVFLPTAHVGQTASWLGADDAQQRILDWDDARAALSAGVEIGTHGHRHLELDVYEEAFVAQEIRRSRSVAEDELGRSVTSMAYPFGYHDRAVRRAAASAGVLTACEVGYGLHRLGTDPFRIRRLLVGPGVSAHTLLHMLEHGQNSGENLVRRSTRPLWRGVRRARGPKIVEPAAR
jgi:peptidoglycan/xylan/chitin deacetylase (PgdA/CDA1 family)